MITSTKKYKPKQVFIVLSYIRQALENANTHLVFALGYILSRYIRIHPF